MPVSQEHKERVLRHQEKLMKAATLDVNAGRVRESREQMIFRGTQFSRDEIVLACTRLEEKARVLIAAAKAFSENFEARNMVEIKLACEYLAALSDQSEKQASQVAALSRSLAQTFTT